MDARPEAGFSNADRCLLQQRWKLQPGQRACDVVPSVVQIFTEVSLSQLKWAEGFFLQASCSALMFWDKSLISVLARGDLMAALQG